MDRLTAQSLGHPGDIVFLEQANGGDAGGSGFETRRGVFQVDSTEGEHRNRGAAGLCEQSQTGGSCSGQIFFLEDGSKDGEARTGLCGLRNFFQRVAGDSGHRRSR